MRISHPIPALLVALTVGLLLPLSVAGRELADGEREFVHKLLDQNLFELAEQYCGEQLKTASSADERADWEFVLSECHQQHAWWMNQDSRNGMISLAVQRITEFLQTSPPTAEKDIQLRVRQIELLTTAGILETVVRGDSLPRRRVLDSTQFALEAVLQADKHADSLLKQIDEIRRDLDADVVRIAREQIRFARAQILRVRSLLSADRDSSGLRDQADQLAEQLLRSTNDPDLQFRIRRLLAELQLDRRDFAAFDLRFTSLLSAASTESHRASAAAMKIRGLLLRAQPSDALQECVDSARQGIPVTPELMSLRLQALLQLTELLFELEESAERDNLRAKSVAEFMLLRQKTLSITRGAWHDRCLQIIARFDRVQRVGPEAATLLEEIDVLVNGGDLRGARQAVQAMILQPRSQSPKLLAMMLLQSGDLAVRLRDWDAAVADLSRAVPLFQQTEDIPGAAAADLLRVFAVGQQWNAMPAAEHAEQHYLTALNDHIAAFDGQPTVAQAREWRARLMRVTAPLEAAVELLEIHSTPAFDTGATDGQRTRTTEQLNRLALTGDLLLAAMATHPESQPDSEKPDGFQAAVTSFTEAVAAFTNSPEAQEPSAGNVLVAQQLGLSLRNPLPASSDWKAVEENARELLTTISDELTESATSESSDSAVPADPGHIGIANRSQMICHAMIVLASVRQLKDAVAFESSRAALTELPREDRVRTVQQLMRQLRIAGEQLPGDSQLAHFLISLLTTHSAGATNSHLPDQQIAELPILIRLGRIAGSSKGIDERLNSLLSASLTDSQLLQLAEIVAKSAMPSESSSRAGSTRRFWQSVQKRTKPGQESWFEASLQMAILAEEAGDLKEASRILGVVGVLHPEWGSPSRKARAKELQMRLESAR